MTNNNFFSVKPGSKKQKVRKYLFSILLGTLTFGVTPAIALIFSLPFLIPDLIPASYNPIKIITSIFGLTEATGYFAAQFIFIGLFALLGDFMTGLISLFINNRSKKLAFITFVSAIVFQVLFLVIFIPVTANTSQEIMETGIEKEGAYQKFAKIGNVNFSVKNTYSKTEIDNQHPEYGPFYKKLEIIIPVIVLHPGIYKVAVRYSYPENEKPVSTPMKSSRGTFEVGEHKIKIEFFAQEISSYGYWSPDSAKGFANIELSYISTNSSNKFVERKQIKF